MAPRSRLAIHDLMDCYKQKSTKCKKAGSLVNQITDDPHVYFKRSPFKGIDLDAIGEDTPDDTDEETDTDFDDDDLIKGVETDQDEDSDAELDDGRENTRNKDTETDDDDDEEYKAVKKEKEERKKEQKLREKAAAEAEAEEEEEEELEKKNGKVVKRDEDADMVTEEEIFRSLISSANPSDLSTLLTTTSTVTVDGESVTSTAIVTAAATAIASATTTIGSFNAATATETIARNHVKEDFQGAKEFFTGTGIGLAIGAVLIFLTAGLLVGGFALYKRRFGNGSGKP